MKKLINTIIISAILVISIFILTGCTKEKSVEHEETSNDELTMQILSLNLNDNNLIQVRVDYPNNNDVKFTSNEKEPEKATLTNKSKNYTLKLLLDSKLDSAYYEVQASDKNLDGYTESKFSENDGYYYLSNKSTIKGKVLIDTLTDNNYKYISFEFTPAKGNKDVVELFKQEEVQSILSSFGFRYTTSTNENSTQNQETKSTGSLVGQWGYYSSYTYTFNEDGTGTYDSMGTIMNFTYEADGKELSILYTGNTSPTILGYKLDGNRLIITDSFGDDIVYVKK